MRPYRAHLPLGLDTRRLRKLELIVPHPMRRKAADQVLVQLIEADVDIGFGLVDEARAYRAGGQAEFSSRALKNAEEVVAEIEQRLQHLGDSEAAPFLPLVTELRNEIAAVGREQ